MAAPADLTKVKQQPVRQGSSSGRKTDTPVPEDQRKIASRMVSPTENPGFTDAPVEGTEEEATDLSQGVADVSQRPRHVGPRRS